MCKPCTCWCHPCCAVLFVSPNFPEFIKWLIFISQESNPHTFSIRATFLFPGFFTWCLGPLVNNVPVDDKIRRTAMKTDDVEMQPSQYRASFLAHWLMWFTVIQGGISGCCQHQCTCVKWHVWSDKPQELLSLYTAICCGWGHSWQSSWISVRHEWKQTYVSFCSPHLRPQPKDFCPRAHSPGLRSCVLEGYFFLFKYHIDSVGLWLGRVDEWRKVGGTNA